MDPRNRVSDLTINLDLLQMLNLHRLLLLPPRPLLAEAAAAAAAAL